MNETLAPDLATTAVAFADSLIQSAAMTIQRVTAAISGMGTSEWIAFGSMLAAWIAAWYAFRSTRLSGRMYSLSVAEQRRTEPAIEVYLADCHIVHLPSEQRRVYVFYLLITNKSLTANSIKEIKLSLEYGHRDQPPSNVAIPHDSTTASTVDAGSTEILRVPSPIAAGESIAGAAIFPIANAILGNSAVGPYTVTVLDAHDREAFCSAFVLKEKDS